MEDKILTNLNDMQREAVRFMDGALLVLAGAGSGKTRVITHRFAYLMREKQLRLQNILAVTFTNKAAGEMKERISSLVGIETRTAWVRTFHSMGVLIIRKNPEAIGYPRDFVIYDDTDSKNLVKSIMKDFGISAETFHPGGVSEKISSLKDSLTGPDEFDRIKMSEYDEAAAKVYREYERILRKNKAVDFPDLISLPIKIFSENPPILNNYQDMWRYIMVDEFQDTNSAQYKLVNLIVGRDKNVCVVGDDDQSIYGWRGANIDNIYDFKERYGAKVIPLEQNYRSTEIILSAANSIVQKIPGRMQKKLWTEKKLGDKIKLIEAFTDKEESGVIVGTIDRLLANYEYRDFAIFYRTNAQSRLFEEALLSHNIPYKIFGGQKFYERKEIKDILSYIKIIVNPFDGASFDRVINVPKRKIGDTSQDKIKHAADNHNISYVEALTQADQYPEIMKSTAAVMKDLGQILLELNQSMDSITPTNFVKILLDSIHYKAYIENFDEDGLDRWSNVDELINSIKDFENANPDSSIVEFLNEVTLQTSVDTLEEDQDRNYVSLMTIHNAKGLEFPVVFISGTVSGLIPHISSSFSDKEIAEERRLFYVAITRAKDKLFISYPDTRMKYGEVMDCLPSPFLKDIPEDLTEPFFDPKAHKAVQKTSFRSWEGGKIQEKRENPGTEVPISSIEELVLGDTIRHRQFGKGKVTFISERFIKVNFDKFGVQNMSGNFLSSITVVK